MRIVLSSFLILCFNFSYGNISLPAIFADHMVLQQESTVTVWGWGKPREQVVVTFGWKEKPDTTVTDNHGEWKLEVETPKAGGPFQIDFQGYNQINLKNVLIGEVWLCAGQSNMEWSARSGIHNAEEEISLANYPDIRLFSVVHRSATSPQIDLEGSWKECTPETMQYFSAVAYFFARKLHQETGVPVGLINSSWGGTPAETWMDAKIIEADELLKQAANELKPVPWGPVEPGRLYNAMIAPLIQFKIAGALWYQGEGNTANAHAYEAMFSSMIQGWRKEWGYDFPFYYAQIAPYKYGTPEVGVAVRDAQRRTLKLLQTGMVVTSDIGNVNDIHPQNKQDVGLRMANLALVKHYKVKQTEVSGPLFNRFETNKNKVTVFFDHAKGLKTSDGKVPDCFELAGSDGQFYPAKASIHNNKVVLTAEEVDAPKAVRYAWDNIAEPNLVNDADLPASSFKSN